MSFTRDKRDQIKNYILDKIDAGDDDYIEKASNAYNISDKTVYRYLREMVEDGILIKNKRQYRLSYEEFRYDIKRAEAEELGEDLVYTQNILKHVDALKTNVRSIWDYGFTETSIPLKNVYDMPPVARSQAKRLVKRLENFEEVILDFEGVEAIGQGFAHELFVVFRNAHPDTRLIPVNTNDTVNMMISHVMAEHPAG